MHFYCSVVGIPGKFSRRKVFSQIGQSGLFVKEVKEWGGGGEGTMIVGLDRDSMILSKGLLTNFPIRSKSTCITAETQKVQKRPKIGIAENWVWATVQVRRGGGGELEKVATLI